MSKEMSQRIPCALLMNDIHVSKDNISEFKLNWQEALNICAANNVKDLIVGGDLWQSRSSQTLDTLLAVRNALIQATKAGLEVTLAEGNHDLVDQESFLGYNHIFDQYPGLFAIDDWDVLRFEGNLNLYVMSYFPEKGSFIEKLNDLLTNLNPGCKNILYIHEGVQGALGNMKLESELPQEIFADFDRVLVGHYHNRCVIKGTAIEYIGSSRQHNFGEDEEKGYTLLFEDGSYEFIKNRVNTRYKVIEVDAKQVDSKLTARLEDIKAGGRYKVKVKINCLSTEAPQIDKKKLLDAGATKVEIVTEDVEAKEVSSQSLDKKYDKTGIKNEYEAFCSEKEIEDVEFGLQYLDKID